MKSWKFKFWVRLKPQNLRNEFYASTKFEKLHLIEDFFPILYKNIFY